MDTMVAENRPDRLPAPFYEALEALNQRAYFECHEILEALWIPETGSVREVYQGVLQIAVGCYHLVERANWVGAVNKLEVGTRRLERAGLGIVSAPEVPSGRKIDPELPFGAYGVAWQPFLDAVGRLQRHLQSLGRENVAEFDPNLLPTVHYQEAEGSFQSAV